MAEISKNAAEDSFLFAAERSHTITSQDQLFPHVQMVSEPQPEFKDHIPEQALRMNIIADEACSSSRVSISLQSRICEFEDLSEDDVRKILDA